MDKQDADVSHPDYLLNPGADAKVDAEYAVHVNNRDADVENRDFDIGEAVNVNLNRIGGETFRNHPQNLEVSYSANFDNQGAISENENRQLAAVGYAVNSINRGGKELADGYAVEVNENKPSNFYKHKPRDIYDSKASVAGENKLSNIYKNRLTDANDNNPSDANDNNPSDANDNNPSDIYEHNPINVDGSKLADDAYDTEQHVEVGYAQRSGYRFTSSEILDLAEGFAVHPHDPETDGSVHYSVVSHNNNDDDVDNGNDDGNHDTNSNIGGSSRSSSISSIISSSRLRDEMNDTDADSEAEGTETIDVTDDVTLWNQELADRLSLAGVSSFCLQVLHRLKTHVQAVPDPQP
jgi:hypothetical protein